MIWSYPAVSKNLLSGENLIVVIFEECLFLYFLTSTNGSNVLNKHGERYTIKPWSWAIANNYPSWLNWAAITTPLKLNYAIVKYPLRLNMTEYPALSMAMSTTPFGEMTKWLIWCGV